MSICSLCQNLKKRNGATRLALDFKPVQLLTSVSVMRCVSCSVILEGILCFQDATWSFNKHIAHVYGYSLQGPNDTLSVELYFIDERPRLIIEFFHPQNGRKFKKPWQAIRSRRSTTRDPLGPASINWVTSLLEKCLLNHEKCPCSKVAQLPRRILALDDSSGSNVTIRLEENEQKIGCYATLSHCWGDRQRCITIRENIEERKLDIPWNEIPKTFQDSITYCLKLGIRYLWIDALCIIQNDNHDWEVESSKMADIYQNSFITLAATAAKSDMEGCFIDNPISRAEYKLNACGDSEPILVRQKLQHWESSQTKALVQQNPLLTRGWVFQERILSPRVLHFCNQELVWECAFFINCECGGVNSRAGTKSQFAQVLDEFQEVKHEHISIYYQAAKMMYPELFPTQQYRSFKADSDSSGPDDWYSTHKDIPLTARHFFQKWQLDMRTSEKWHRIVEAYSALQLTRSSDRLPALSGLAVRSAGSSRSYMAGLWEETISSDILWRVDKLQLDSRRLADRGPSWSWVSVSSGIKYWALKEVIGDFDGQLRSPMLTTAASYNLQEITCATTTKGENKFGEVKSGILDLTGYMRPSVLNYVEYFVDSFQGREQDPLNYTLSLGTFDLPMHLPFHADYILSGEGNDYVPNGATVYLLEIFPSICLVLRPTVQTSIFNRIGIFRNTGVLDRYGTGLMNKAKMCRVVIC